MRVPPTEIVRDELPPDGLLLVVRGGRDGLSDVILQRSTEDTWAKFGFFGVSVFGAPDDDLIALSREELSIRQRSAIRLARCGVLRQYGFEVVPTFADHRHFSVVMGEATPADYEQLRASFSEPIENPGYERPR